MVFLRISETGRKIKKLNLTGVKKDEEYFVLLKCMYKAF